MRALGPSSRLRAVAKALQDHQPNWLFLIDRDSWPADAVERQRQAFRNGSSNLLTWRRRAIENYIVDPEVFRLSTHLKDPSGLEAMVLDFFERRLYFNAANIMIEEVREERHNNWIHRFTDPEHLQTRQAAMESLVSRPEWPAFSRKAGESASEANLRERFQRVLDDLTGGRDAIEFGQGAWLERMDAKPVLSRVVNERTALEDRQIQGPQKLRAVVRDLTRKLAADGALPVDFAEVRELILIRVQ